MTKKCNEDDSNSSSDDNTITSSSETEWTLTRRSCSSRTWWLAFAVIILLTCTTRLHRIAEPDHVCWDETHFGKMGSWYINRTFFFDVHPPLGKMMIGFFGKLTGYDGTFPFNKPGDKYENVSYVGMRLCCVTLGAFLVPFSFLTVWEMTRSLPASILSSSLVLFDNGIITLSQYILLDPILMFFIMGAVFGSAKVSTKTKQKQSFSVSWWFWLIFTGTFLACSISVKFVGLFVVLYVGVQTISDLWDILGDISQPVTNAINHFIARTFGLIIVPLLLYMAFFYIHLKTLNKSGTGDGFFSSAFQSQLEGNSLYNASMPREVAYGAVLTFKSQRTGGGYLHSHWHLYPEGVGARQQQVTTYSHKDDNNKWLIKRYNATTKISKSEVEFVLHGDLIRLEHVPTRRNLHGHKEPAPVTKKHYQVTCYGENGTGDANDIWKIEVVGGKDGDRILTVTSKLKLTHILANCALHTHTKQLPKWAYEQMEVSCNPNLRDMSNLWNVEDNVFPHLPNTSFEVYAPGFLASFLESHAVMFQGNSGLKPKEGEVTSKPWQWPINYRGQFFSGNSYRIYLLGNPVIWWGNLVLLLLYLLLCLGISVRWQRGYEDLPEETEFKTTFLRAGGWMLIGWALHYIPFWGMGRILYFHHYFPAALFSSMLSGIVLDYLFAWLPSQFPEYLSKSSFHWLFGGALSTIIYSFYLFSPLTYGMEETSGDNNSTLKNLKWLESWEF